MKSFFKINFLLERKADKINAFETKNSFKFYYFKFPFNFIANK